MSPGPPDLHPHGQGRTAGATDPLGHDRSCPLCNSLRPRPLPCDFDGLLECSGCGFIFADPSASTGEASYEEDFADSVALKP